MLAGFVRPQQRPRLTVTASRCREEVAYQRKGYPSVIGEPRQQHLPTITNGNSSSLVAVEHVPSLGLVGRSGAGSSVLAFPSAALRLVQSESGKPRISPRIGNSGLKQGAHPNSSVNARGQAFGFSAARNLLILMDFRHRFRLPARVESYSKLCSSSKDRGAVAPARTKTDVICRRPTSSPSPCSREHAPDGEPFPHSEHVTPSRLR